MHHLVSNFLSDEETVGQLLAGTGSREFILACIVTCDSGETSGPFISDKYAAVLAQGTISRMTMLLAAFLLDSIASPASDGRALGPHLRKSLLHLPFLLSERRPWRQSFVGNFIATRTERESTSMGIIASMKFLGDVVLIDSAVITI